MIRRLRAWLRSRWVKSEVVWVSDDGRWAVTERRTPLCITIHHEEL